MTDDRTSYGMDAEKMAYSKTTADFFSEIDATINGITKNPINHPLTSFAREFIQNEKTGLQVFNQMNAKIDELYKTIDAYSFYKDTDIVKNFMTILDDLALWSINLRQSIMLSKKKMQEIQQVVSENYLTKIEHDRVVDDYEKIMDKNAKGLQLPITNIGGADHIIIPPIYAGQFEDGEMVLIRRLKVREAK